MKYFETQNNLGSGWKSLEAKNIVEEVFNSKAFTIKLSFQFSNTSVKTHFQFILSILSFTSRFIHHTRFNGFNFQSVSLEIVQETRQTMKKSVWLQLTLLLNIFMIAWEIRRIYNVLSEKFSKFCYKIATLKRKFVSEKSFDVKCFDTSNILENFSLMWEVKL